MHVCTGRCRRSRRRTGLVWQCDPGAECAAVGSAGKGVAVQSRSDAWLRVAAATLSSTSRREVEGMEEVSNKTWIDHMIRGANIRKQHEGPIYGSSMKGRTHGSERACD
eukprot:365312-Chlamydomonas_euryale.AAC.3